MSGNATNQANGLLPRSRMSLAGKSSGLAGNLLSALAAKQTTVQCSTRKKHFFDRGIHGRLRQDIAMRGFDLKLGASAHEFLNERPTDTLGATNNQFHEFFRDFQATGVEFR